MTHRELTPRSFCRLIAPAWRIDREVWNGHRLDDVYRLGDDPRLIVELRRGDSFVKLSVTSSPQRENRVVGGLGISYLSAESPEAGNAACRALGELLTCELGDVTWSTPPDAELLVPDAVAADIVIHEMSTRGDPDRALLDTDAHNYRRLFRAAVHPLEVAPAGEGGAGISMRYDPPTNGKMPPSGSLYRVPAHFHRRRFRRYFAALGCTYDDGFMRTVPTPTTFARVAAGAPLRPRLVSGRRGSVSGVSWVKHIAGDGVLVVPVAPGWAVALHRVIRRSRRLSRIPVDVGMLAHDVSLHAIGLHAVDEESWQRLRQRARTLLAGASRRKAKRVAAFFEDTLTRAAWDVWKRAEAPEDFGEAFAARTDALEASLTESARRS